MNFIRIGKSFIHLDTYYDQLDKPTISPEAIAMSIQDAIECLGDCDCENVGDYIEDNAEMLEDNE